MTRVTVSAFVVVVAAAAVVVVLGVPVGEEDNDAQYPPLLCAEYPPACKAVGEVVDKTLGLCSIVFGNHITIGALCVPSPGDKSFALQMFLEMVDSRPKKRVSDRLHIYLSGEGNATLHYNGQITKRPTVHLVPESLPHQWIHLTLVLHNRELHLYRRNIPWEGVRWPLPANSAFAEMSELPSASASTSDSRRDLVLRVHTSSGTEVTFNCAQGCPRHNATSSLIGRPFELQSRSFVLYLHVLRPEDFLVVLNVTGRFKEEASNESREVIRIGGGGGGGGGGRESSSSSSGGRPQLEEGMWHELLVTVDKDDDGKDLLKARLAGEDLKQVKLRDAMHLRVAVMRNVEWTIGCNPEIEEKDTLEAQKERWRREEEEEEERRREEQQRQEEAEAADASAITAWTLVGVSLFGMFIVGVVICTGLRPYGGVPEEPTPASTPSFTPASMRHGALPTPSISLGASQQTLFLTAAGASWGGNGGSNSGHFLTDTPRIVFSKVREAEEDWDPTAAVDPASLEPLSISTSILTTSTTLNATRDDADDDDDDVNDDLKGDSLEDTSHSKVKCKAGMEGGR